MITLAIFSSICPSPPSGIVQTCLFSYWLAKFEELCFDLLPLFNHVPFPSFMIPLYQSALPNTVTFLIYFSSRHIFEARRLHMLFDFVRTHEE